MASQKRRPGRNDRCSCGSGRKYKHCCESQEGQATTFQRLLVVAVAVALIGGLFLAVASRVDTTNRTGRVWSAEHGHYH
jgi:hypothetical protein